MARPTSSELFASDLWATALEKYGAATNLTVQLFDADERGVFGPVHPTPLFRLLDEAQYRPGLFAECARRCIAQTNERPAVIVSRFHGLAVVGTSLMLDGSIVGAAVGGYALIDFSQVSEIQRLGREAGIAFAKLWQVARRQAPVPRQRLLVNGELLQVLGDALLSENYRRRQYEQAAAIVDSSEDAIIGEDLAGITTSWNAGADRLFGYTAAEAVGKPIALLIHPEGQQEEQDLLERIRRGDNISHYETIRRRKDGSLIEISLTASPIRDASGSIVGISKIARDISERRQHDQQRELLMSELNHRVKNTLATVQSFAMQTLRHVATLEEGRDAFEARLAALAQAHDVLTQQHWEGARLDTVVTDAIAAYEGEEPKPRFNVKGPFVHLSAKAVLALSMALHELATNAVKHGALSNGTGKVDINWELIPGDPQRVRLLWTESGGPPVQAPRRRGFGSRLVEQGLAHDLGGDAKLTFAPEGLVCAIDAPLVDDARNTGS